jgi:divalent metal cation (Fe/Co/Zn/Cd) transporter
VLGFEMYSLLLGEAASPEEQTTIRDTLAATPGVAQLMQLRTMHLGPEELLVAARVELDPDLSADDAARVIDRAQAGLREQVPSARIIYLEPELPVGQPGGRSQR